MDDGILIRTARSEDREPLLSFCQNTFDWGDYVQDVWEQWLTDRHGCLFVSESRGRPIGMLHVALLTDGSAWMEGIRVHPEFRRRGVASKLDQAARSYASKRGYKLARLASASNNNLAHCALAAIGYRLAARYREWSATPARGSGSTIATEHDLGWILARWAKVSSPIVANPAWRWEKLSDSKLTRLVRQAKIRVNNDGFAILREMLDANALILHALVGNEGTVRELATAARTEAHYRGFDQVQAMVATDLCTDAGLRAAGFECPGEMYLFEDTL